MPVYRVVYDARDLSSVPYLLTLVAFVAAGVLIWSAGRADAWLLARSGARPGPGVPASEPDPWRRADRMRRFGIWVVFVVLLVGGSIAWLDLSGRRKLHEALKSGDYTVVEGEVTDFVPGDRGGHREESFAIVSGGRRFEYRYTSSSYEPGFHESHGPIRAGLRVRIADVDGAIARLEIAP